MAKCPKCSGDMDTMATVCPDCGHSFPDVPPPLKRTSWAYSRLANMSLVVGMVAAGLWAAGAVFGTVATFMRGDWYGFLFSGPLIFFLAFAMFVVFARASDMEPRDHE